MRTMKSTRLWRSQSRRGCEKSQPQERDPVFCLGDQLVGEIPVRAFEDPLEIRSPGLLREQDHLQVGIDIHPDRGLEELPRSRPGEWGMPIASSITATGNW